MLKNLLGIINLIWGAIAVPLVLLVVLMPPALLVLPLPLKMRLRIVGPFWRIFAVFTLKWVCWARIYARDERSPELRTHPPRGLYIANHQSFVDIPLACTQFQIPPIMKKEVLYIPLIGILGWASGALPVSRGKRDSRKKIFIQAKDRLVTQNIALQYYPEGTRSKDGLPKSYEALKVTLIQLAHQQNIPVIPFSMYGTKKVIGPNGLVQPGQWVGIIIHKEILPSSYPDVKEFTRATWAKVVEGHEELRLLSRS